MRLQAVWTHCVKIGSERRTSQTYRPIRGLHLKQEPYRSRSMRTELGYQQYSRADGVENPTRP